MAIDAVPTNTLAVTVSTTPAAAPSVSAPATPSHGPAAANGNGGPTTGANTKAGTNASAPDNAPDAEATGIEAAGSFRRLLAGLAQQPTDAQSTEEADGAAVTRKKPAAAETDIDPTAAALAALTTAAALAVPAAARPAQSAAAPTATDTKTAKSADSRLKAPDSAATDHAKPEAPAAKPTDTTPAAFTAALDAARRESGTGGKDVPQAVAGISSSAASAAQALAAAQNTAPAAPAPVAPEVTATVGTPKWQEQVSDTVTWMAKTDVHSAEIKVTPPDMGTIQIQVTLEGEKRDQAIVQFVAAHPDTRDALENALPRLREMLAGAGITLADSSVGQQAQGGNQSNSQGERASGNGGGINNSLPAATVSSITARGDSRGLVDTFA